MPISVADRTVGDDPRGATIVCAGLLPEPLMSRMRDEFGAAVLPAEGAERDAFLRDHGADVEVVVTSAVLGLSSALLDRLPRVRLVASFGVGVDSIDVVAAQAKGVQVSYTPDVLTGCVADLAVGMVIDLMRGISRADRFVRRGSWPSGVDFPPMGRRVHGVTVGVLGLGAIGAAVADRLRGFDCRIAYHSRNRRDDVDLEYVADPVSLAATADVLVVTTAGGTGTAGLVSEQVLSALGPAGYLVNVSRGSVVDEGALVAALEDETIAGAALDVFAHEPHVPQALLESERVLLLPHIGSATTETRVAMCDLVVENVMSFVADGTLHTPVVTR